jgi:DNA-binding transcriptional MerR regulator
VIDQLLAPYKGREDLTIDDLVHVAAEVVPQIVAGQWRHKVTEVPDARTIRYYIQQELVGRPSGSSGVSALYGYRHLLQIVATKALQSEFVPIREIKKLIGSLSQDELEARLEEWAARRPREAGRAGAARGSAWAPAWQTLVREPEGPVGPEGPVDADQSPPQASPRPASARRYLLGLQKGRADLGPEQVFLRAGAVSTSSRGAEPKAAPRQSAHGAEIKEAAVPYTQGPIETAPTEWRRFELYPGIELHVKEGTEVPDSPSFFSVLASRLRVILEHLRKAISR